MPRKNNPKKEHKGHVATIFDDNYNHKCYGCPFAGRDFVCATSDGVCLKSNPAPPAKPNSKSKLNSNSKHNRNQIPSCTKNLGMGKA